MGRRRMAPGSPGEQGSLGHPWYICQPPGAPVSQQEAHGCDSRLPFTGKTPDAQSSWGARTLLFRCKCVLE